MICRHCSRRIYNDGGLWIDPEATEDDSIWRETCDAHDTFMAEHEPIETHHSRFVDQLVNEGPATGQTPL
jgi:hypothetical protein